MKKFINFIWLIKAQCISNSIQKECIFLATTNTCSHFMNFMADRQWKIIFLFAWLALAKPSTIPDNIQINIFSVIVKLATFTA